MNVLYDFLKVRRAHSDSGRRERDLEDARNGAGGSRGGVKAADHEGQLK